MKKPWRRLIHFGLLLLLHHIKARHTCSVQETPFFLPSFLFFSFLSFLFSLSFFFPSSLWPWNNEGEKRKKKHRHRKQKKETERVNSQENLLILHLAHLSCFPFYKALMSGGRELPPSYRLFIYLSRISYCLPNVTVGTLKKARSKRTTTKEWLVAMIWATCNFVVCKCKNKLR